MKRRLYTLDVFTTKRFEGNPLAVITDGDGLAQDTMQAIAREMNLSETVFVQRPTKEGALARLRIFTTQHELPFAGHPVVGTWYLMAELGVVPAQEGNVHILQQTGAGVLPVEIEFHDGRPVRVTMTQKAARFVPSRIAKDVLAQSLGLKVSDLHPTLPIEFVSTGIFNAMVPLRDRSALKRIQMNPQVLARQVRGKAEMAYCFALGRRGKAFARGMLPWEIGEDPATGSAGGSLGAYLVRHEQLSAGARLEIVQGVEMGRPCRVRVQVFEKRGKLVPRVSGSAVRVFEGEIEA